MAAWRSRGGLAMAAATAAVLLLVAAAGPAEVEVLMRVKEGLDPGGIVLGSWDRHKDPCGGAYIGVACDSQGKVTNISLQGRGLAGHIPDSIAELTSLTALYLHYNKLGGRIPSSLGSLAGLSDVYLNVNQLVGSIPLELGDLASLQALQLCCNQLSGTIPDSLGRLRMLRLLSLQHNHLQAAIPPSLGQLSSLTHLDLSYNQLTGTIPAALDNLPQLSLLDVRSNHLSGSVPSGLRSLEEAFVYTNNTGLCGQVFLDLPPCGGPGPAASAVAMERPEPLGPPNTPSGVFVQPRAKESPSNSAARPAAGTGAAAGRRLPEVAIVSVVVTVSTGVLLAAVFSFIWFRRHKQRISNAQDAGTGFVDKGQRENKGLMPLEVPGKCLHSAMQSINVPKSSFMKGFQFRLEELEMATNYFSDKYLLARKAYMSIYRAVLRDGSTVVIKEFTKTRLAEDEFESAIALLMQLKQDNLVRLRGFCCLKGALRCYLVYDHVPNGTLFEHLHGGTASPLDWSTRVQIAHGVARGLDYLHCNGEQIIVWASNVLLDDNNNALISGWGINTKILADEVVYAGVKTSAMLGYLAPEYGVVGHLNEKTDVYAFGVLLLELLSGCKPPQASSMRLLLEQQQGVVDPVLGDKYSAAGAAVLASIALACTSSNPTQRPSLSKVVHDLEPLLAVPAAAATATAAEDPTGFSSSGEEYPTRQQAAYRAEMLDYGR